VLQVHDQAVVETAGRAWYEKAEDGSKVLRWCPATERRRKEIEERTQVRFPGEPVAYTSEATVGLNLKEA
jgi:hypothetical protein